MLQLTQHFTLEELTHSDAAVRKGLDNTPHAQALARICNTARHMEVVRMTLRDLPIKVHSCYRSPAVNKEVGGSSASAHMDGDAIDFSCPTFGTPQACAKAIIDSGIKFDQIIYEGAWVHISFAEAMRSNVLTAHFLPGQRTTYTEGIA